MHPRESLLSLIWIGMSATLQAAGIAFDKVKTEEPVSHYPGRLFTALILIALIIVCGCSPEAIESPSAPIYGMGLQEAWIPMPDGVRLANGPLRTRKGEKDDERFPVLLEYLPYRKTESRGRDYIRCTPTSFGAATSSPASICAAPETARAA